MLGALRLLLSILRESPRVLRAFGVTGPRARSTRPAPRAENLETAELMRRADDAARARRRDEAATLYREVLRRERGHVAALRGLRDISVERRQWAEALALEERLASAAPSTERAGESEWLAIIHYELGRSDLAAGRVPAAIGAFRHAVRADRRFVPATLALGDALERAGETREAVRVWERGAELEPSLPLLARLEHVSRAEGRPSRMIALYRAAIERAPDNLALAVALGRVYFELEMLDEAVDQFEKVEVRAPDLPVVHAFLGATFERRGQVRDALEEYRHALRLAGAFSWPHRCRSCGAIATMWEDRCSRCGRWNTLAPVEGR